MIIYRDTTNNKEYKSLVDYRKETGNVLPIDASDQTLKHFNLEATIIQEPIVEPDAIDLDIHKSFVLQELNSAYLEFRASYATVHSSLGFKADATERAMIDVGGLVETGESKYFRDADNQIHKLTPEQLKVLRREIIDNGEKVYAQKWAFEEVVRNAKTQQELEAVRFDFK